MYLGFADFWCFLAYALCIASVLLCIVYGVVKWNKNGGEITPEDVAWAKNEDDITKDL
jgi:hypothetical protein